MRSPSSTKSLGSSFGPILHAARGGDRDAFEDLYHLLSSRVGAYARVRGCHDPEGLVNDVFLQVFTSLASFSGGEAQFKAWVFRIARNKLIDQARRNSRRVAESPVDDLTAEAVAASDDVEADVLATLGTMRLLSYLEVLTPEQREVIVLRTVADLTVDAIADLLGKQPGAIKALQRRAVRTLERSLSSRDRTPAGGSCVAGR